MKHIFMLLTLIQLLYYLLVLFSPLIMSSSTSELFEFNKMIFIYFIALSVLAVWIVRMILSKKIIFKKTIFDIPIVLFLTSQIISTIFSIDVHTSLYGYYGRFNGGLLSIISYITLYYAFVSNFTKRHVLTLLKASLISSFIVILWGLPGKFGHDLSCLVFMGQFNNSCWTDQFHPELRMFSTLGQPNWLGAYLVIHFFIAVYFIFNSFLKKNDIQNKKGYVTKDISDSSHNINKIFLYLYLFFNFTAIIWTRSRSAVASIVFGATFFLLTWVFLLRKQKSIIITKAHIFIFIIILVLPILIFKTGIDKIDQFLTFSFYLPKAKLISIPKPNSVQNQIGYAIKISESFDIRKIVWKGAIDLGKRYPLFGSGVETFAYGYYFVRPIEHNLTSEWDYLYNKAHNEFLNYFATTGYVGIFSYLIMIGWFLIVIIKKILKKKDALETIFLLSILLSYISILITNFFGFSTTMINIFFYLIPAFFVAIQENNDVNYNISYSLSKTAWMLLFTVIIVTIFGYISLLRYLFADINYAKADGFSKNGDYQTSISYLTQAIQLKYEHVYEDKLSYMLANLALLASYQKQTDISKKIIPMSDQYNKKSIQSSASNVLYWKTRAKNQYLFYQITLDKKYIEEGIISLEKAKKLAPTDPKIPYSLSVFFSLIEDEQKDGNRKKEFIKKSLDEVNTAINLKSDFRDGYLLKGQLLKKYGDKIESRKIFEYILNNINSDDVDVKKELLTL